MTPRSKQFDTLVSMLTYRRPEGSLTQADFIARYIANLPNAIKDTFGNWHVTIGESPILWSCHTDTVHWYPGRQTLHITADGVIKLSKNSKRAQYGSTCLGADDTAGCFIMREMVLAGVPGHYVFHCDEEHGGNGSSDIARHAPESVSGSLFAIAFDRRGYSDVITRQAGSRCCSDAFALSLALQLNATGLKYQASDRGVFTDTANYTEIIGECTNLSVGYDREHSTDETLDTCHVFALLAAVSSIDPSALANERLPEPEPIWYPVGRSYDMALPVAMRLPLSADKYSVEFCERCQEGYNPEESDARDYDLYCSIDCELMDLRESVEGHGSRVDSPYLDPVFEQVNEALDSRGRTDDDDEEGMPLDEWLRRRQRMRLVH